MNDLDNPNAESQTLRAELGRQLSFIRNLPGITYRGRPDWSAEFLSDTEPVSGYTHDELVAMDSGWLSIVHEDDRQSVLEEGSPPAGLQRTRTSEYRIRHKSGAVRWVRDHKTFVYDALKGVLQVRDVVRNLGTFSRVEEDELVPVDVVQAVEVAISMSFNQIKYRARLIKDYGPGHAVIASAGRLSQVFLNLLINAAHAIPDGNVGGNEIRVRTWKENDRVCVEIRDTGRGIDVAHQRRVFEPFFSTKEVGSGTGLGLAISKSIVEGYGGSISLESTIGVGSSFTIRLPLMPQIRAYLENVDNLRLGKPVDAKNLKRIARDYVLAEQKGKAGLAWPLSTQTRKRRGRG
jgi:PAS domain S-box-containing protein